ncbi:MAG: hypothetical protein M3431_03485 [Actinomycetota bacterium]|nr:hypothetical protein [Actinomycetota bacterium]
MSIPTTEATSSRQRTKIAAAALAVATAGVIGVALNGTAQADSNERPAITVGPPSPTFGTSPPFTFITVSPTFGTIPPFTFVTIFPPGSTAVTTTTTAETTTTTPGAAATTNPSEETAPSDTSPGGPAAEYTLDITAAQINCDGTIHVEYATTATPEPPNAADHLVVFNPTSNPVDFHVVETVGNAPNGAFVFEQLGSIADTYRVFVIALFEPTNLDGPKLVDQTDVLLAPNCA